MEVSNDILLYLIIVLTFFVLILFILVGVLFSKIKLQKRRYDTFMGTNKRPEYSLENKIDGYFKSVKEIESHYKKLLYLVEDIDSGYKKNIQKVGLIKYNPFAEMGGNLCFALAILDGEDNGVVINGIHSRTGSFTYAKPIEHGVSIYLLSEEEIEAIEKAKETAHKPKVQRTVKVKFKPDFRKKPKEPNKLEKAHLEQKKQRAERKQKIENLEKSIELDNKTYSKNSKESNYENNQKHNDDRSYNNNDNNISSDGDSSYRTHKTIKVKTQPKRRHESDVSRSGGKRYSVGDVTEAEKSRILEDEQVAMKIAKAYEPQNVIKNTNNISYENSNIVDNSIDSSNVVKNTKHKRTPRFSDEKE